MKITLISFDNWGLNKHIAATLEQKGHEVHHIDFHSFSYRYPNVLHKVYNFFLKTFMKKNLKNMYYGQEIIKKVQALGVRQDIILTIKGDFIDARYLKELKNYTDLSIGFFNDNIYRCPKIKRVYASFDKAFSFEREDSANYNMGFAPNWIYTSKPAVAVPFQYDVFNISSKGKRISILQKIAKDLNSKSIPCKFMVLDKGKPEASEGIEYIQNKIPLEEVMEMIAASKTLLDINRFGQKGLTFRVFESLGLEKKLITTNSDIVHYDFYNPNNILVIDEEHPTIPVSFFENEYEPLPQALYYKYTMSGWVDQVVFGQKL